MANSKSTKGKNGRSNGRPNGKGNGNGKTRVPPKAVYTIIERENADRDFWLRIGTAFVNRDDSLTVFLDASPANNRLHIRDTQEREDEHVDQL